MKKQATLQQESLLHSSLSLFTQRLGTKDFRPMQLSQDVLNWGLGIVTLASGSYGVYMNRKSKKQIKNEEDSIFVDNAEKLTGIWERLSNGFQSELAYLRKESKEMLDKYTELKIELEVSKSKSDFVIEQLKLQIKEITLDRDKWRKQAEDLRDQIGTGVIKKFG